MPGSGETAARLYADRRAALEAQIRALEDEERENLLRTTAAAAPAPYTAAAAAMASSAVAASADKLSQRSSEYSSAHDSMYDGGHFDEQWAAEVRVEADREALERTALQRKRQENDRRIADDARAESVAAAARAAARDRARVVASRQRESVAQWQLGTMFESPNPYCTTHPTDHWPVRQLQCRRRCIRPLTTVHKKPPQLPSFLYFIITLLCCEKPLALCRATLCQSI
jgi:hypothetical protein